MSTHIRLDALQPDDSNTDSGDFGHLVRDALAHLYDTMHLQTHPLTAYLRQSPTDRSSMVGKALRRSLLDAIDGMRPPLGTPSTSKIHRKYRIIEMRFVEEVDPTEIQRELAMSKTEYYREHAQALAAVTSALREKLNAGAVEREASLVRDGSPMELAEQEAREICSRMQLEMIDLRATVREVVRVLDPLCRRQGIDLLLRPEAAPCVTQADRVGLRQALLTSIRKVMDAVAPGRVNLRVTLRSNDVNVQIQGVPNAPVSSISQPLDLTVARCLIECLRGRVEIIHADDVSVDIILPTTKRSRLLVVDNNLDFVALVSRYLNQENWEVLGASDAQHMHQIIEATVPNLILLDVMMPARDGWEILRQLKSSVQTQEIPVIICSVLDDEQLAVSLGADGYLLKPLAQNDLLHSLRRWQVGRNVVETELEELIR